MRGCDHQTPTEYRQVLPHHLPHLRPGVRGAEVDTPTAELTTAQFVKEARKLIRGIPNVKTRVIVGEDLAKQGFSATFGEKNYLTTPNGDILPMTLQNGVYHIKVMKSQLCPIGEIPEGLAEGAELHDGDAQPGVPAAGVQFDA